MSYQSYIMTLLLQKNHVHFKINFSINKKNLECNSSNFFFLISLKIPEFCIWTCSVTWFFLYLCKLVYMCCKIQDMISFPFVKFWWNGFTVKAFYPQCIYQRFVHKVWPCIMKYFTCSFYLECVNLFVHSFLSLPIVKIYSLVKKNCVMVLGCLLIFKSKFGNVTNLTNILSFW